MIGILGKKIGMTNIFDDNGRFVPVTLIEAGPCAVLGKKTEEKSGYCALLLGYSDKKAKRTTLPVRKWFEKLGVSPKKMVKEIRTAKEAPYEIGDIIDAGIFKEGDWVDVTGITKGKGFQGGMKRWNWAGGVGSHGSMFHRAPGSIGASSYPSRVWKGQHLPGHMGAKKTTAQNLKIVKVEKDKNILMIKGAVPGHKGCFLLINDAKKHPNVREAKQEKKKEDEKSKA
ncbi:MAG: 50S ribosomal protein L3 [Candidatus Omnitrophica bacterium]|nr:50S ribosomal protein L3 [Candidatus Omnitrophota bacterium]